MQAYPNLPANVQLPGDCHGVAIESSSKQYTSKNGAAPQAQESSVISAA